VIPFAQITVAAPAQATTSSSPCSSEGHSAQALGRDSQLLPLSVPPLPRVLVLFKAFGYRLGHSISQNLSAIGKLFRRLAYRFFGALQTILQQFFTHWRHEGHGRVQSELRSGEGQHPAPHPAGYRISPALPKYLSPRSIWGGRGKEDLFRKKTKRDEYGRRKRGTVGFTPRSGQVVKRRRWSGIAGGW
jgi:hypothetical protein